VTIQPHRRRFPLPRVPVRLRGLRPRLVFVFLLVVLVSVAAATAASYRAARTAVLAATQDAAMSRTRQEVAAMAQFLEVSSMPLYDLQKLTDRVTGDAIDPTTGKSRRSVRLVYRDKEAPSPGAWPPIPAELRREVGAEDQLMYQRFRHADTVMFAYGMPVLTTDGTRSGLEVYVIEDLTGPRDSIEQLTVSTAQFTGLALVVAVIMALLAARGVLRPVRQLRAAAQELAAGKLDTRLRVRGADELADLANTFNFTAAQLEHTVGEIRRMEANARRFVADVSHELRTPLAAMTAVTDTLDEEADNLHGDAGIAAHLVSTETRRLAQLVDNLIEITRFDAGRAELRIDGDVDLAAAVNATLAARGWTDQVQTVLPPGVLAQVDRRRIDVMVANLVGNALRHGQPPVTVHVDHGPTPDGQVDEQVTVLVTDCGPGLPPDVGAQVFERFYKADTARSRSEGSGLGLAIALENARLHGGTINAGNLPHGGAFFQLILPRRQPCMDDGRD
jgi:two-component system sensor histidine kinase MtrB